MMCAPVAIANLIRKILGIEAEMVERDVWLRTAIALLYVDTAASS
jgi:hypothetical protein